MFLLDEFPQLAYMRPIEEALLYMAGYGARFWFFVQDMSQLKLHYPKSWRTFMANTGTQSFFGISDIETAKLVSETVGVATVLNRSVTESTGQQTSNNSSTTRGHSTSHTSGSSSGRDGGSSHSSNTSGSSSSHTTGSSHSYSEGFSNQVGFIGRRLITPDEVMRLREDEQIIFMKGMKPIRCILQPYYTNDQAEKDSEIAPPEDVSFF
ncbi:MAG: type IV secretory system conjugative DNA transfer family protein [Candidatus Electrothrix sp. ATG1]|nr:type IV secretory system conjugative DNA transfer family protein [Candidatus Electrothrix sp. ATG1]